jgi:hypothetical protein
VKFASWFPKSLEGEYKAPIHSDSVVKKLIQSERFAKHWKSLGKEERAYDHIYEHADESLLRMLARSLDEALNIEEYELITPAERKEKSSQLERLVNQTSEILRLFGEDKSALEELKRLIRSKARDELELLDEFMSLASKYNLDKVDIGRIREKFALKHEEFYQISQHIEKISVPVVLLEAAKNVKEVSSQVTVLPSPNTPNFKEIYFIRKLYLKFKGRYDKPFLTTIETLVSIYYPDSNLNYIYIKDCVDRFKKTIQVE